MISASAGSASTCLWMASRSSVSACSLCGLAMLTSGSRMGTRPGRADPVGVAELLLDDRGDPGLAGVLNDRPHLGAEDPVLVRPLKQVIEGVDGLHELHAVVLVGQPQVHLQDRHDVLALPQVAGGRQPVDLPLHGLLEENRRDDAVAVKCRAGEHAGAQGVDEVEHLGIGAVPVPADAVLGQRPRRAAAALVEGREEARRGPDLLQIVFVHAATLGQHRYRGQDHPLGNDPATGEAGRRHAAQLGRRDKQPRPESAVGRHLW